MPWESALLQVFTKCSSHEVVESEGNHLGVLLLWHLPWGDIPGAENICSCNGPLRAQALPASEHSQGLQQPGCLTLLCPFPSPLAKRPLCSRDLGCSCLHRHPQAIQLLAMPCAWATTASYFFLYCSTLNKNKTKHKQTKKKPHFQL